MINVLISSQNFLRMHSCPPAPPLPEQNVNKPCVALTHTSSNNALCGSDDDDEEDKWWARVKIVNKESGKEDVGSSSSDFCKLHVVCVVCLLSVEPESCNKT